MWGKIVFFAVIGVATVLFLGIYAITKGIEVLNEHIKKGN